MAVFVVVKGILLTAIAFGFMIFVHELGHFLAAKLVRVRVERFSFGFGPKLVGHTWGGTDYRISAVPLGGYVKLAGGDEGEESKGAPDEFISKTPGQRTLVFLAGPLFSVLFGIPLAMGMLLVGRETPASQVQHVAIGSPAWDAGVRYGDRIRALGSSRIETFEELRQAVAESPSDEALPLLVERGGREATLTVRRPRGQPLGVICGFALTEIKDVQPDTPADAAGILPGDKVLTVNGQRLRSWFDFRRHILPSAGRPVELTIEREGRTLALTATPAPPKGQKWPDPGCTIRLPAEVGFVRKGFPADGKLHEGDAILTVNGKPVAGWWDVEDAVWTGPPAVALEVQRGDDKLEVQLERSDDPLAVDSLGLAPRPTYVVATVHGETEPALLAGDEIVKAGSSEVDKYITEHGLYVPLDDVLKQMARAGELTVRRGEAELVVKLKPGTREVGQLGVEPVGVDVFQKETLLGSIVPALERTAGMCTFAFRVIAKLFQRDLSMGELMGPLGIAQVTYISATRGWAELFWLIHLITVNIGVFNLLPIPPLDGGHIVMLGYEKVRGKRPSRKIQEAIVIAGFALVVVIFLVATFNDLHRLLF